jgi:hypothetical protein
MIPLQVAVEVRGFRFAAVLTYPNLVFAHGYAGELSAVNR